MSLKYHEMWSIKFHLFMADGLLTLRVNKENVCVLGQVLFSGMTMARPLYMFISI